MRGTQAYLQPRIRGSSAIPVITKQKDRSDANLPRKQAHAAQVHAVKIKVQTYSTIKQCSASRACSVNNRYIQYAEEFEIDNLLTDLRAP